MKERKEHYFMACEMLSHGANGDSLFMVFRDENDDDVVIEFPIHEDFLDAMLLYREVYRKHINSKLE